AARAAEMLGRAAPRPPAPAPTSTPSAPTRRDRYYPYLRLAEAYLLAGQPAKAQEALKRSAARGREPADERTRLGADVEAALEKARPAAAPPTTLAVGTAAPAATPPRGPALPAAPAAPPPPPPPPPPRAPPPPPPPLHVPPPSAPSTCARTLRGPPRSWATAGWA